MNGAIYISTLVLVFGASVLFLWGAYLLWDELNETGSEVVKRRIRRLSAAASEGADSEKYLSLAREEINSPLDHALLSLPRLHHLDRFLEQTGVAFGPTYSLVLTVVVGALVAVLVTLVSEGFGFSALLLGFFAGASLPWFWLERRRVKRRGLLVKQLPDTMDYIARSMRAGNPFIGALKSVADEMPQPLASEFEITFDELNYGLEFEEAMHHLATRIDAEEARFFVTAVLVQKSSGGNLAEILNNISSLLRARIEARGEVKIQAAEMRASARVLIALPFIVAGMLQLLNPEYFPILLETPVGQNIVIAQIVLMIFGYLVMRRLVNFRI